ncbi:MAG: hypothetical protein EXS10_04415 [Phycisphaerales bacterium]|nr:hypothetical protein [Phycisphaerales bacterium]
MSIDPRQLLRRLEPAVRPTGSGKSSVVRASMADGAFDALLELARDGEVQSHRFVDARGALDLSNIELEEIANALDQAESRGFKRALIVTHDGPYVADVQTRSIERPLGAALEAIDCAIRVGTTPAAHVARVLVLHALPPLAVHEQIVLARTTATAADSSIGTDIADQSVDPVRLGSGSRGASAA